MGHVALAAITRKSILVPYLWLIWISDSVIGTLSTSANTSENTFTSFLIRKQEMTQT